MIQVLLKRAEIKMYRYWQKSTDFLLEQVPKENQQNHSFFLYDEVNYKKKRKRKKTTATKYRNATINSRNFLTNISYRKLNKKNHLNLSFGIDCYSFITLSLDPFSLERKSIFDADQQQFYILWQKMHSKQIVQIYLPK